MFRPLVQLTKIACLSMFVGCTSGETITAPPANNGGDTAASVGGSDGTGGSTASTSGVSLGGDSATGGAENTQGGTKAATGGAKATGGVAAAGGGSATATGQIVMTLTLNKNSGSNDPSQGTLWITLASGAANIPASSLKFTLCGKGESTLPTATSLNVNDGRLVCPSSNDLGVSCPNGNNVTLTGSSMPITVTGTGPNCCYNLDLSKVTVLLAQGGHIEIHYLFNTGTGIVGMQKEDQTWSALVDGQVAAKCTVGTWADSYPVSCR